MSTWRGSSPKVSRRGVVVSTKLVEPSVPGAAWTTSPATVRETTECHVDVAPQSLMGRSILGEPAWLRDRRASYGVGWLTLTQDWGQLGWWPLCCVCGPASGFWLTGAGISYGMPPNVSCQQLTVSMSRRRMQGQVEQQRWKMQDWNLRHRYEDA